MASTAHGVFTFDSGEIVFSSQFDNGNLARVERSGPKPYEFKIWTAADNMGTSFQSKHNAWFHFVVSGVPQGAALRITIVNASPHSGLYKHDMRPVYRCNATNQKWCRIKSSVRVSKADESSPPQLSFDYTVEGADDKIFFAFTYPYTYSMVQADLASMDAHTNNFSDPEAIYWQRELVSYTRDNRRLDLVTISSCEGAQQGAREPLLGGIFPESTAASRPPTFPNKDIIFVSARVHPGEVPAQWTLKGMLSMLLDKTDMIAREIRRRYVIKVVPMLNPDGVYRGHFRMDQFGQNLNRYYLDPDPLLQGPIFAAKKLIDHYAETNKLAMYIDLHAHASKRGCFIYGNVMDSLDDQVQNMLFCRLVAMNTPHFDYEGCLFSREHMTRIDPGDAGKGLTAEGSSRVATYLSHGLVHSYTLECNYNTSKVGNEVSPTEGDPGGQHHTSTASFCSYPEKFSPSSYAGVGRACLVALLDLRGQNPYCRIFRSKYKTVDRVRQAVLGEVRQRKEYKGQAEEAARQRGFSGTRRVLQPSRGASPAEGETANKLEWKRTVNSTPEPSGPSMSSTLCASAPLSNSSNGAGAGAGTGTGAGHLAAQQGRQAYPITYQDFLPPGAPGAVTNGGQVDSNIASLSPGDGHTSSSARKVMTRLDIGTGTGTGTGTGVPGSRSPTGSGGGSPGAGRSPRTVSLGVGDAPDRLTPPLPSSFGGFGVRRGAGAAAGAQDGTVGDSAPAGPQPRPPRPSGSSSGSAGFHPQAGGARASNSSKSNGSSRHGSVLNRLGRPGMAKLLLEATRAAAAAAVIGGAAQVPTEGEDGPSVRSLADQIHSDSGGGQGRSTSLGLTLHSHSTHTRHGHGSGSKETIVVAAPLSQRQVGGVRGLGRAGTGTGTGTGAGAGAGTASLMVGTLPNPKQGPSFLSARSVGMGGQGASYALLSKVALSHQQVMLPLPLPVSKNGAVMREGPLSPIVIDRKR